MSKSSSTAPFWAMMCHLSTLLGFVMPGFSIIAPLLIWGLKRDEDLLIQENGRNVINFILSFWVYSFGLFAVFLLFFALLIFPFAMLIPSFSPFPTFGFFFYGGCGVIYGILYIIFHLVLPIYGGLKAFNGEIYRYPLTISFLKEPQTNQRGRKLSAK
jgi:uncharacterized Tic20 family protein